MSTRCPGSRAGRARAARPPVPTRGRRTSCPRSGGAGARSRRGSAWVRNVRRRCSSGARRSSPRWDRPPTPPGVLDRLIAAGLDCARLNCSHGTHEDLRRRAAEVRAAAARAGRAVGLLFDLQGPKLRLAPATEPRPLVPGETVTFVGAGASPARPRGGRLRRLPALVTERSEIVIGDGVPRLAVERVGRRGRRRARRLARAAVAAQGHQRHLRAARAAGDHREGRRRPRARGRARRRLRRAVVRALGGRHRAAARSPARARLAARS